MRTSAQDRETSQWYYRARYYDSSIGRFMSEDLLRFNAGGPDFYLYVANSVLNATDPRGTSERDVTVLVSKAANQTQVMIDAGLRHPGSGIANNMLATGQFILDGLSLNLGVPYYRPPYLGCGDQASFVITGLTPSLVHLDDTWTLDQAGEWGTQEHLLYHQWITATSSNPNDPDIIIDPWNNQYQLVPKGGKPNAANWQPLAPGGRH